MLVRLHPSRPLRLSGNLIEQDDSQLFLPGFVSGLFGLPNALLLDISVGDGGSAFGVVYDAGLAHSPVGHDKHLNDHLTFLSYLGVDLFYQSTTAGAIADASAAATTFAWAQTGAGARANA